MESVEERLNKLRDERVARERARIDKLRELNLKKYPKNEAFITPKPIVNMTANKAVKTDSKPKFDIVKSNIEKCASNPVKNKLHVNGTSKRLVSAPVPRKNDNKPELKPIVSKPSTNKKLEVKPLNDNIQKNKTKNFVHSNKTLVTKSEPKMPVNMEPKNARKSLAPIKTNQPKVEKPKLETSRKSMMPTKATQSRESVFDRLYKPKMPQKNNLNDVVRLQKDPVFLQKVLHQGGLIANKRHTLFEPKIKAAPVRRSISAVHFKRISKKELSNCFHKWSSIGEKLDEVHLSNINEDDSVKQDLVTSAVKSERKKVRLLTPSSFNTPRPEELQNRLSKWLKSRGKSIDSYHHLQCFGIHHLGKKPFKPLYLQPEPVYIDDENKENIALEHDSDNDSYTDNMNDRDNDFNDMNKWRSRVSYASDSICMNDSHDTTLNSEELPVDDLLLGALNDLTELLREGFDWEQCARWLRALRERFPDAPRLAAYWECRAALEERRGDLPASVQCWEEAIAKGTKHSVVDANLDHLLDKFMQLKISPSGGRRDQPDPKLVDVKNVFKSTIIRFAVQQAKLRQSRDQPKYTMTPVRRSSRLSCHWSSKKTPLRLCSSVKQASEFGDVQFIPNATLCETP